MHDTRTALLIEAEQLRRLSSNPNSQVGRMPPQPPTLRGRLGAVLVRLVRRSLFWYTQQINEIVGKIAETLVHHAHSVDAIAAASNSRETVEELSLAIARLAADVEALQTDMRQQQEHHRLASERIESISAAADRASGEVQALRAQVDNRERVAAELAERIRNAQQQAQTIRAELAVERSRVSLLMQRRAQPGDGQQTVPGIGNLTSELGPLYLEFENAFRGTRADIKARCAGHVSWLREKGIGAANTPVLDLGCGRGEWLEALAENGLVASGVDSNTAFVQECRARGFAVHHGDALSFLQAALSESQGAITAFHLIEHLPFAVILKLLDEAIRVLKPGGILMLETPNPANLLVGAHTFYLDPTHIRPLPADLMRFIVEARGFCDVRIVPLHPFEDCYHFEQNGRVAEVLNQLLYGPRDYLIIGQRP